MDGDDTNLPSVDSKENTFLPINIKIKQEKLTPPRPELKPDESPEQQSQSKNDDEDEKKPTEPIKTSNELLAELFKVFNAAPPDSLLNLVDDDDGKKSKKKKKHKEKKHKKKSKKKSNDKSGSESGELTDQDSSLETKTKKKIKSEHKHSKKSSHKDDTKKKDKGEKRVTERTIKIEAVSSNAGKDKSCERTTNIEITTSKTHRIQIKNLKNSLVLKSRDEPDRERKGSRKRKHDSESEFSISDEDVNFRSRSSEKKHKSKNYEDFDKFYASYNDNHSRYKECYQEPSSSSRRHQEGHGKSDYRQADRRPQYDDHHRPYSRERPRNRSYSRGRSRSRSGERIDKKRLLEIARKNAILMLKNGSIPGAFNLAAEAKDKIIAKMKYTGKTVEELTQYCKTLSNGEDLEELDNVSTDGNDSDHDREGNSRAFNHPFMVKDRGPIVMNIRNATAIPPKSAEQTKALSMLFPVSSGSAHKQKTEEWVPVSPNRDEKNKQLVLLAKSKAAAVNKAKKKETAETTTTTPDVPEVPSVGFQVDEDTALVTKNAEVFPKFGESLDVSQIISQRLNAMRKLQENPTDSKAMHLLQTAQKDMSTWASSKFVPGQFLGSTGVNVLTAKELSSGHGTPWAKKDQLITAQPLTSGMGMHLLQKMGWRPGEGLGKDKTGSLQPLLLEVKLDKRGLVSIEESTKPKRVAVPARMTLDGKHPVSLLGELASKRKWGLPQYIFAQESGPQHCKSFVFKVRLNGMEYQPAGGCNNKKEAKAMSAKFCLQQLGVLPM